MFVTLQYRRYNLTMNDNTTYHISLSFYIHVLSMYTLRYYKLLILCSALQTPFDNFQSSCIHTTLLKLVNLRDFVDNLLRRHVL